MANEQNLRPSEYKLSQEEAKKGGINSGKTRKQKADLRKMAQSILDGTFKDKNGKEITGQEAVIQGLLTNLADPKGRNWGKAMDLLVELTGSGMTNEQKAKLKAETAMIKARTKEMQNAAANTQIETASDNFLDALSGTAAEDWEEEAQEQGDETSTDSSI